MGITGFAKFDGGDVVSFPLTELGPDRLVHPITAQLPMQGTRKMELWFRGSDVYGCVAYDSNFGANYRFDLQHAPTADSPVISFETDWSETQSGPIHAGDASDRPLRSRSPEPLLGLDARQRRVGDHRLLRSRRRRGPYVRGEQAKWRHVARGGSSDHRR